MLPQDIQLPGQLLAVALAVERGAADHYAHMAERMRRFGNHESAELFNRLVSEGRERENKLIEWASLKNIEPLEFTTPITWNEPLIPTTYDTQARDPYRSTPYKALAYAVHNIDRTFHLYTHISANTNDQKTEKCARILARDALNRTRLLTARRRRAYRTEKHGPRQQQFDKALRLTSLSELHRISAKIEMRLTNYLAAMNEYYEDLTKITEESRETMERCQRCLCAIGEPAAKPDTPYDVNNIGNDLQQDVLMLFTESERAFSFYDMLTTRTDDEDILLEAQRLSESAVARLEAIRQVQRNRGIRPPS